jgi:F-type H+-transporting ATPase subunit c
MKAIKKLVLVLMVAATMLVFAAPALADTQEETTVETTQTDESDSTGSKAMAAAVAVGLAAAAGAIGMGIAIGKSAEGISRQPEATGSIRTALMLGLVFIETAIIYALIVAILIIFVL